MSGENSKNPSETFAEMMKNFGSTGFNPGPDTRQASNEPDSLAGSGADPAKEDLNIKKESTARAAVDESRARNARIVGYGFAIAWCIIFIIFFNFFSRYIAYYEYNAAAGNWDIIPFITSGFYIWLPVFNAAVIVAIIGNIILIINDSFYFDNIVNIVMHIFGIASVATLLALFPFDFSMLPNANLNQVIFPALRIVLIFIIVGLSIGVLVRFIRVIVKTARTS